MSTLLDEPEIRASAVPISVETYHELGALGKLGEDVELLDGFVIKKMSKSPLHETTVRRLARALLPCLPPLHFIAKESPLTLAGSEPEPDLSVISGDEDQFATRHPSTAVLVVEVAVRTLQKDLRKASIYAAAGVGEYWLIEPETRRVTVFRQPAPEGYLERVSFEGAAVAESGVLKPLHPAVGVFPVRWQVSAWVGFGFKWAGLELRRADFPGGMEDSPRFPFAGAPGATESGR